MTRSLANPRRCMRHGRLVCLVEQGRGTLVHGGVGMNPSYPYDSTLHQAGSVAASGGGSRNGSAGPPAGSGTVEAVVSFQDRHGRWQSGCSLALEQLVERGEIKPLSRGA